MLVRGDFDARTQWIADNDFNIRHGGFSHTYCCDREGTPLPVKMLRFDNLAADWQALVRDWDLPAMDLGRENSSGLAFERGIVSQRLWDEIMDYCWRDCERFGYDVAFETIADAIGGWCGRGPGEIRASISIRLHEVISQFVSRGTVRVLM